MEFSFAKKNPVLSKFSADRFFEMETKFKKLLKWNIIGNDQKIQLIMKKITRNHLLLVTLTRLKGSQVIVLNKIKLKQLS